MQLLLRSPVQVAFPVGQLSALKGVTSDLEFMEALMKEIRSNKVWPEGNGCDLLGWGAAPPSGVTPSDGDLLG